MFDQTIDPALEVSTVGLDGDLSLMIVSSLAANLWLREIQPLIIGMLVIGSNSLYVQTAYRYLSLYTQLTQAVYKV